MSAKDPLLEHIRSKLRESLHMHTDQVAGGGCVDYADYKYQTGIIEGLAVAERHLLDADEMQHRSDDN
jgi:hypothetical protein